MRPRDCYQLSRYQEILTPTSLSKTFVGFWGGRSVSAICSLTKEFLALRLHMPLAAVGIESARLATQACSTSRLRRESALRRIDGEDLRY